MNEWILLAYPFVLIACLMLAARWQPKSSPAPIDDRDDGAGSDARWRSDR